MMRTGKLVSTLAEFATINGLEFNSFTGNGKVYVEVAGAVVTMPKDAVSDPKGVCKKLGFGYTDVIGRRSLSKKRIAARTSRRGWQGPGQ